MALSNTFMVAKSMPTILPRPLLQCHHAKKKEIMDLVLDILRKKVDGKN